MFTIANGRTGRETPCFGPRPSFSFRLESSSPQSTTSPSREPRFIVGPFESRSHDEPSHSEGFRHSPSESSFRIELTHIREKDLLSPPLPNRRWSESSDATSCEFREEVQEHDTRSSLPKWPGILRFVFRFLILLESIAVLAITTHSVSTYTESQSSRFADVNPARPAEVNLFPTSFLQVVAGVSLVSSILTWLHALRRRYTGTTAISDPLAMMVSGLMTGLWVAATAISRQYERPDEPGLPWWACHQGDRPLRDNINYNLVCAEQTVVQDMSITLSILEVLTLLTFGIAIFLSRRTSTSSTMRMNRGLRDGTRDYRHIPEV